uniref:hypothetical protein n=1 Tax=Okeania sp. SIO2F4 TaxID=2607790 RepID=UPI0025F0C1ED|nr:hypothetical protein [Okeania sp. SIO2F4]
MAASKLKTELQNVDLAKYGGTIKLSIDPLIPILKNFAILGIYIYQYYLLT